MRCSAPTSCRARHPTTSSCRWPGSCTTCTTPSTRARTPSTTARGRRLVEPLLGGVARLVAGHVVAKRYLVSTDPAYREALSARSVETLARQGGDLDGAARRAIDGSPDRHALLTLRRADDRAKVPGAVVPSSGHWRPVVAQLVSAG